MSNGSTRNKPTIHVSAETLEKLHEKKRDGGHSSLEDLIQTLLSGALNNREDEQEEEEALAATSPDPQKRTKKVREALITVDLVKERDGMMEDYTGLTIEQFDKLCARMNEEVSHFVFQFETLWDHSCSFRPSLDISGSSKRLGGDRRQVQTRKDFEMSILKIDSLCFFVAAVGKFVSVLLGMSTVSGNRQPKNILTKCLSCFVKNWFPSSYTSENQRI